MTYLEALKLGYTLGKRALRRGYVSRKTNIDNQEVLFTNRNKDGQPCADLPYVMLPNFDGTWYCYRQYLNFPEATKAEGK